MVFDTLEHLKRPVRILLVEDGRGDALLIKKAFRQSNIPSEITLALSGEEALEVVNNSTHLPDIIVLDLNLPGMNGKQVLRTLKEDTKYRRIPVIILSSSKAKSDVTECYDLHANSYIVKPHDIESLCHITEKLEHFWFSLAVLPHADNSQ